MGDDRPYYIELVPLPQDLPPAPKPASDASGSVKVVTQDEEIYCPICGYNLSGIFSGRCPECGAFFDRTALIAAQQANAITLIPWDDPQDTALRPRLYRTLRICLLDPKRFAFAFSVRPRESRAASFLVLMLLATTLIGAIAPLVYHLAAHLVGNGYAGFSDLLEFVLATCSFVVTSTGLSTVLSAFCLWLACPHYDGQRHFRPWLSIAAYAAAHYLLAAAMIPLGVVIPILMTRASEFEFTGVAILVWMGCAALFLFTLQAVIDFRTAQMDVPRPMIFALGAIHLGSTIAAVQVAIFISTFAASLMRLFY